MAFYLGIEGQRNQIISSLNKKTMSFIYRQGRYSFYTNKYLFYNFNFI